jgi:hypothetical protein
LKKESADKSVVEKVSTPTVRVNKPFTAWDIPVYALTVIAVFLLLLFFVILPSPTQNEGFSLFVNGKKVVDFDYSKNEIVFQDANFDGQIEFDQTSNTITVRQGEHFNVVKFNSKDKSVKVIDANCSISKDCVHTPELKNGSAIVCAPHKLKITALGESLSSPPVTGGVR